MRSVRQVQDNIRLTLTVSLLLMAPGSLAQDKLDMQGTQVIGNRELPNMLYIIPWKSIKPVQLTPPPIESVMDEPLQALDREQFQHRILYYNSFYPHSQANSQ
jgi:hypothetical protein